MKTFLVCLFIVAANIANAENIQLSVDLIEDLKMAEKCPEAPKDAQAVWYGDLAVFILYDDGALDAVQDDIANALIKDYCFE